MHTEESRPGSHDRRVFAFGDVWYDRPIAYLRKGEPMIEVAPHQAVNLAAALRFGLVAVRTV